MMAALQVVASRQAATTPAADGGAADATLVISADLGERPVVARNLFGIFLEHLGRCIYGGVCDTDGTLRADVSAALAELRPGNLRWPGGCFADGYHWRDGIGPPAARLPRTSRS